MFGRRLAIEGEYSKHRAVNVERVRHSDRDDLPYFARSELGLDVNPFGIMELSVNAGQHRHIRMIAHSRPLSADAVVEHELAALNGNTWVRRRQGGQT